MTSYWCEFAWLGGEAVVGGVVIDVDSGRISSITTGVQPCPTAAVRLAGVTLPGMANAHSHAFHRLLRGRTHAGPGSFWTWREQMYTASRVLDPSNYFVLASAVFAEMAMAGISALGEFHYVHHGRDASSYDDRNAMGNALIAAANQAGIRITLLDACYLYGGLRADGHYAPSGDRVASVTGVSRHGSIGLAIYAAATLHASGQRFTPCEQSMKSPWLRSVNTLRQRVSLCTFICRNNRRKTSCASRRPDSRPHSCSTAQVCWDPTSPPCTLRTSPTPTSTSSGRPTPRSACARLLNATWPTGSVHRSGSQRPVVCYVSAAIAMQ